MKNENDFKQAQINLKATCTYQGANHTDKLFVKDEMGNCVENWRFYISNDKENNSNFTWITLLAFDKDENNITQIDFDEISKNDLSNLIKDLVSLYKTL